MRWNDWSGQLYDIVVTKMMHLSAMLPETEEITPGSGDHGEVDDGLRE